MTKLACIGEAMIELSMKDSTAGVGVAGDSLNTAIYLKRMAPDLDVDYVTQLGDDPFSDKIADFITAESLGTENIARAAGGSPGLYAITTDDQGERTFTYWRGQSAARGLFSNGNFTALDHYDVLYLSGISLAILPQSVRMALLNYIKNSDQTFVFDSNFRPRLWEDAATAKTVCAAFWAACDIALPSIDDEMALFEQSEDAVRARWQKADCIGALKQGASGPMAIGSTVTADYPAAQNVVDTTAAGDSFNAGYLAAHFNGADAAKALRAGHDLAAKVVQHRGAIIDANLL